MESVIGFEAIEAPKRKPGRSAFLWLVGALLVGLGSSRGLQAALLLYSIFLYQWSSERSRGSDGQQMPLLWSEMLAATLPFIGLLLLAVASLKVYPTLTVSCTLATPWLAYFLQSSTPRLTRLGWSGWLVSCILPLTQGYWGKLQPLVPLLPWVVVLVAGLDWSRRTGKDPKANLLHLLTPLKNSNLIWVVITVLGACALSYRHYWIQFYPKPLPYGSLDVLKWVWQDYREQLYFPQWMAWGVGLPLAIASERIHDERAALALSIFLGAANGLLWGALFSLPLVWPLAPYPIPVWSATLLLGALAGYLVGCGWSPRTRSTAWGHPLSLLWMLVAWVGLTMWALHLVPPIANSTSDYPSKPKLAYIYPQRSRWSLETWLILHPRPDPTILVRHTEEALAWMNSRRPTPAQRISIALKALKYYPITLCERDERAEFWETLDLSGAPLKQDILDALKAGLEEDSRRDQEVITRIGYPCSEHLQRINNDTLSPSAKWILVQRLEQSYQEGIQYVNHVGKLEPDSQINSSLFADDILRLSNLRRARDTVRKEIAIHEYRLQQGQFPESLMQGKIHSSNFIHLRHYYRRDLKKDAYFWSDR
jgi:hypothetical protein